MEYISDPSNCSVNASIDCSDNMSDFSNMTFTTQDMMPNLTNPILRGMRRSKGINMEVQITLYSIIFLLGVVGNALVIVTLIQNKKMRTVTNVFLFNLALTDLLLAVFCMPFTLIPIIMKNFIFGEVMCILIRYLQGVSVAVSCFTLVAISLERYFAICRPLKSRRWQTRTHAYKVIILCWILAFFVMSPIAVYHRLGTSGRGVYRCRENWGNKAWEKAYTMILNMVLLVIPVIIMSLAYGWICYTLWIGMRLEDQSMKEKSTHGDYSSSSNGVGNGQGNISVLSDAEYPMNIQSSGGNRPFRRIELQRALRQSNSNRSRAAKKRVIKMLFAVVLEFFICWAPAYIVYTWMIYDIDSARIHVSNLTKSLIHLLSYVSSCCNPITYCFLNKNFRQAFIAAFRCCRKKHYVYARRSEMSFSGNTNSTRTMGSALTSYDKIAESDELSEKSF